MSADVLRKIQKATSSWFKGATRRAVAEELSKTKDHLERASLLPENQRKRRLRELLNTVTFKRQQAFGDDARSYGDREWAPLAASEAWLQSLLLGDEEEIREVERLVAEMMK